MQPSIRPIVFLDRDGVINERVIDDWVSHVSECHLLPGALEAIVRLNHAGYRTVVVTNQRGLAIGRLSWEALNAIHDHLSLQVAQLGGRLDEFYICPHDRPEACACRKPQPGLLDAAARHEAVDWSRAFLVGDRDSDIAAGKARGVATLKVAGPSQLGAEYEVPDLAAAVETILNLSTGAATVSAQGQE